MTDSILSLDVESRSTVDLRKAGAHRYWQDETTALWCACYAFDDEPVQTWRPGESCPTRVREHIAAGGTVSAWNAAFERLAWQHCLVDVHGWPVARMEQFEDTAAWAGAMALPRALGQAAEVLDTYFQKDDEGHRLMMRMAKPRRPRKGEDPTALLWWDDEDRIQRLIEYCILDVETERALRHKLVPLSPAERKVYGFDQRMNDRGVRIDVPFVKSLMEITDKAKRSLDKEMTQVTLGQVTACSQVTALTGWVSDELCTKIDSLDKNAVTRLLDAPDTPDHVRRALSLRQQAAKSSTAKLNAMLACVGDDGRARGLHLYHGASTGRWAGRLIQPQNMPRGTGVIKDPDAAADDLLTGDPDRIDFLYGPAMSAVSDSLRACLTATPGNRLLVADYSSIEGRVTAWLAGEHDEVAAYRAVDAGTGAGIYEIAAGGIFGVDPFAVSKGQRQVGKAATLALGYAGGVMAFKSMADIYGIDMTPVYPILRNTADPDLFERAVESYDRWKESGLLGTDVLGREAWIASEVTKLAWRGKHPATVDLWGGLESAAFDAVQDPGTVASYAGIAYIVRRGFLWCRLPSGRCLAYGAPRIAERKTPWGDKKDCVTALGVDGVTRKWRRFALYGGLATENCVQAIARDLIAVGMLNAEAAGYPIVLTVHDEAVADVPAGHGTLEDFSARLCDMPAWADGLPVVADGYEAFRYRKD